MFIDSGKTKQIITSGVDDGVPQFTTTLRYFPKEELNCYDLALTNEEKFIFRAGFYYANYDGKSQPPVFDLLLGGQLWETVNSSASNGPIFHELIYNPINGNISVCLRAKKDGGIPFISSLEATYLMHDDNYNQTVYTKMKNGSSYHLVSRINFGGYNQVIKPWSPEYDEELNRYWMPQPMPGYVNLSFEYTVGEEYYENRPPTTVLNTAITPQNASQSIHVPITFPTTDPQSAYMVLYFYQNLNESETLNSTRYMDIYVDGFVRASVKFDEFRSGEVVTIYPLLVQDIANVTISPANGTVLPPLLNGMEVFIASELIEQPSFGYKISSSLMIVCVLHFFVIVLVVLD
ncbi:hypothetical protein C2S52_014397 [Perilla frutescens var. hirtella]|nr:hypothetical protein C2S52_014397 [Perilla frutescens var. hirtella]